MRWDLIVSKSHQLKKIPTSSTLFSIPYQSIKKYVNDDIQRAFSIFYAHKSSTPNITSITITTTCNTMYYTTYNNGITIANCNTKWSLPLPMPLTVTITINHHWSQTLKRNKNIFESYWIKKFTNEKFVNVIASENYENSRISPPSPSTPPRRKLPILPSKPSRSPTTRPRPNTTTVID